MREFHCPKEPWRPAQQRNFTLLGIGTGIIIAEDTGARLWNGTQCADYIGVTARTWSNYYANGRTPKPVATWGKAAPLWDAEEIKAGQANRPGSPWSTLPRASRATDQLALVFFRVAVLGVLRVFPDRGGEALARDCPGLFDDLARCGDGEAPSPDGARLKVCHHPLTWSFLV